MEQETSKCERCAIEHGSRNLEDIDKYCIWRKAGKKCPDYGERPTMDSIGCEKVPDDETEILRRQMRLLAEKSRFGKLEYVAEASEVMLKIHGRLFIQPIIRFLRIQILLCAVVGFFVAVKDFFQRRR